MAGGPPTGSEAVPGDPPGAATKDERFTAQLAWVLNLFFPVVAPLLLWRLQAKDSRFVAHHARAGSNHALTVMVYILITCVVVGGGLWAVLAFIEPGESEGGFWLFVAAVSLVGGLGGLVTVALGVVSLIFHIVALMKAGAGEWYEPPMCWRFMK